MYSLSRVTLQDDTARYKQTLSSFLYTIQVSNNNTVQVYNFMDKGPDCFGYVLLNSGNQHRQVPYVLVSNSNLSHGMVNGPD